MINEFYDYIFNEYGQPEHSEPLENEEISKIPSSIPKHLIDLFLAHGRFTLRKGRLQTCLPSDFKDVLDRIFFSDTHLRGKCQAFAYSAFGIVYFFHEKYGCGYVELLTGRVFCNGYTSPLSPSSSIDDTAFLPFDLSNNTFDTLDSEGKNLFSRTLKKHGPLSVGECYGFIPTLALGVPPAIDITQRIRALEHFSIIIQTTRFKLMEVKEFGITTIMKHLT